MGRNKAEIEPGVRVHIIIPRNTSPEVIDWLSSQKSLGKCLVELVEEKLHPADTSVHRLILSTIENKFNMLYEAMRKNPAGSAEASSAMTAVKALTNDARNLMDIMPLDSET